MTGYAESNLNFDFGGIHSSRLLQWKGATFVSEVSTPGGTRDLAAVIALSAIGLIISFSFVAFVPGGLSTFIAQI